MKTYGILSHLHSYAATHSTRVTVRHEGHHPKVLLWIMEEFFHISHDLTDMDHDGRVVLCYELMIEAEHCFRIK